MISGTLAGDVWVLIRSGKSPVSPRLWAPWQEAPRERIITLLRCPDCARALATPRWRPLGIAILATALTGACRMVGTVPFGPPSGESAPLPPCAAPAAAPDLDEPRFAARVAGELSLVRAEGDSRLSAEGGILTAWSADGSAVAFTDRGTVTTWRSEDGKLLDLVQCTPGDFSANEIALSPDERWVVVSGIVRDGYDGSHDRPATCIVDRVNGSARLIDGATRRLVFAGDHGTVYGDKRGIDLSTGVVVGPPTVPPRAREASLDVALSHDRRWIARWSTCRWVEELAGAPGKRSPAPSVRPAAPDFLEMSDRATGRTLWRTANGGCRGWRFSPDDRYLEKASNSAGDEVVDVLTGERLQFPGGLLEIAPQGRRVVVLTPTGPQLWSVGPAAPLVGGKRNRTVVARSRDGMAAAALDVDGRLVIERGGNCFPLSASGIFRSVVAFSPDGSELYAGLDGGNLKVWRSDAGNLRSAFDVAGRVSAYPMPATGRVGFGVPGGVRLYDAHTHASLAAARAPRTRYTRFNAQGRSWPVRDPDGDRPDSLSSFVTATADGRYIVGTTGLQHPTVTIWDLQDPRAVVDLPVADRIEVVAMSPDERFVAAGDGKGTLSLWDRAGRAIRVDAHHATRPLKLEFSPRGDRLAAAFDDGIVDVIDTTTGRTTGTVTLPWQRATYLWWSPNNARLVIDSTRHLRFEVARP